MCVNSSGVPFTCEVINSNEAETMLTLVHSDARSRSSANMAQFRSLLLLECPTSNPLLVA